MELSKNDTHEVKQVKRAGKYVVQIFTNGELVKTMPFIHWQAADHCADNWRARIAADPVEDL